MSYDLRELNQWQRSKYDDFWEGIYQVLERDFPAAFEERRDGESVFLPVAVALCEVEKIVDPLQVVYPSTTTPTRIP